MRNLYQLKTSLRTLHVMPVVDSGITAMAKRYPGKLVHLKVMQTLQRPLVISDRSAFVQVREISLALMENLGANNGIWQYFLPNLPTNERKLFTPQTRTTADGVLLYRFSIGQKKLFTGIVAQNLWSGS